MFLDPGWISAETLNLFTDASGTHGFGGYFSGPWFRGSRLPHYRAFPAFHSVARTVCHRGSSSCVGSQASRTPHQVSQRQPGCGSCMVWSVLPRSQEHEPSLGVVLCRCMQQLHNPTCACPGQTQPTATCIVSEPALTVLCSCPTD